MSGKEAQIILLQFTSITPPNKVMFDQDGADAGCPGLAAWFLPTWTSLQSLLSSVFLHELAAALREKFS